MANLEVGQTDLARTHAWLLSLLFLLTLAAVAPWQTVVEMRDNASKSRRPQYMDILHHLRQAPAEYRKQDGSPLKKLFAANRFLLEKINTYETELEKTSFLERTLLPPMQLAFTSLTGLGNEQAYLGKDRWLFFRPGVDSVMGPAFLDPKRMVHRSRSGNEWQDPPQPNPLQAIEQFRDQLAARDIQLVLLPVPIKASIHPEQLWSHYRGRDAPLVNPSMVGFMNDVDDMGIPMVSPDGLLAEMDGDAFLRTDTHWTPEAMEKCAAALADRLREIDASLSGSEGYQRRPVEVVALGDIAGMLKLPDGQSIYDREAVEAQQVRRADGSVWKRDRSAEVLLLGDSFSNIYSAEGMGWGQAAGLAEQLSYELQAPVDAIIQNDAGAHATRVTLAKELGLGNDRLAGKKVVVWEFATRELAVGDWKLIDMELGKKKEPVVVDAAGGFLILNESESVEVQAVVAEVSPVPVPRTVPYKDHVRTLHVKELAPVDGSAGLAGSEAHVYIRSMQDNEWTAGGRLKVGERVTLYLSSWYDVEDKFGRINRSTIDELDLEEPCWGELR